MGKGKHGVVSFLYLRRFTKKFLVSDKVIQLFQHIKFSVAELQERPFEVICIFSYKFDFVGPTSSGSIK